MAVKDRIAALVRTLPPAQRAGIVVAALVLIMAAVPFLQWITTPSYTLLYSGLDDRQLAEITSELDAAGTAYRLEGARVLVPRDQLHRIRASLAEAGVAASPPVTGYELLDDQALGVSDFRQRIDLQRAWEGELVRTLTAMDAVDAATVRLVLPEDSLFAEQRTPASAAVMLQTRSNLDSNQIEAVILLVSSAVEGLEPGHVTLTDTRGQVLHAPGDGTIGGSLDRHQRRTREFETALASDLSQLLHRATNAPASAVVRARLDFNESETHIEQVDGDGVALREHTSSERFEGTSPANIGTVGVDGGPVVNQTGDGTYERDEATREYGVSRTTTRTVMAPGGIEQLNVAVVVDESTTLSDAELQSLITAAAGLDAARGDQVAISRVAAPQATADISPTDSFDLIELIQQAVALVILAAVAIALLMMARRRRVTGPERTVPAQLREMQVLEKQPTDEVGTAHTTKRDEVVALVEKQPEEIAALLRGWLADRRPH